MEVLEAVSGKTAPLKLDVGLEARVTETIRAIPGTANSTGPMATTNAMPMLAYSSTTKEESLNDGFGRPKGRTARCIFMRIATPKKNKN